MVGETAAGRQILIDWDLPDRSKPITYYSSPDLIEMTASLLRAIYNKTRSFPNHVDFNTHDDEDNNPIIKRGIASTSTPTEGMLEYLQTMTTYSGSTGFNPELAKQSLQNYNPILLYGNGHYVDNNRLPYHKRSIQKTNWVMVGLLTDTVLQKKSSSPNSDLYWSVNMDGKRFFGRLF